MALLCVSPSRMGRKSQGVDVEQLTKANPLLWTQPALGGAGTCSVGVEVCSPGNMVAEHRAEVASVFLVLGESCELGLGCGGACVLHQVRRAKWHLGFVEQLCAEGGSGSSVPGGFDGILKAAVTLDRMGRTPGPLRPRMVGPWLPRMGVPVWWLARRLPFFLFSFLILLISFKLGLLPHVF